MLRSNKEKTIHRKNALSQLYNSYYCEKGVCKYYKTCSKQALADNLTAGYDSSLVAMVGENYDIEINDEKIRILIVGKEGRNKNDLQYSPKRLLGFLNEGKVNLHYREPIKCYAKCLIIIGIMILLQIAINFYLSPIVF